MSIGPNGIKIPPTKNEAEAMDLAYDILHRGALSVGEGFEDPDDDWMPMWLVLTKDQGHFMTPAGVDKYMMVEAVGHWAREHGAICVAHLDSTWMVKQTEDMTKERADEIFAQMQEQHGSTEGIPERTEQVMLAVYTASAYRFYQAPIIRHEGGPPTLEPFELVFSSDSTDSDLHGAMVEPIRQAIWRRG